MTTSIQVHLCILLLVLWTQVLDAQLGTQCQSQADCDVGGNEGCINFTCACQTGYSALYGACYKDGFLNGTCIASDPYSCTQNNSTCDSSTLRCACVDGFTLLQDERNNMECVAHGYVGGVCLDTDPKCYVANTTCIADRNLCLCDKGLTRMKKDLCVVDCGKLPNITNGYVDIVKDPEREVIEAFYGCHDGYMLQGDTVRMCMQDGTYNGSQPFCNLRDTPTPTPQPTTSVELTTTPLACRFQCLNSGSCILTTSGESVCICPSGYSGVDCGFEDLCITQPCPRSALYCVHTNGSTSRACICPLGFKGDDCSTGDVPVTCEDRNVTIRLDLSPPTRTPVCLPKAVSKQGDICFNPGEGILYEALPVGISVVNDTDAWYCVTLSDDQPSSASTCIDLTAFEADDIKLRPWINATVGICFILNTPPLFQPPSGSLVYNIRDMGANATIVLSASDLEQQTIKYDVMEVIPSMFKDLFSVQGNNLVVLNPGSAMTTASLDVGVKIQLTDNGVPSLSSNGYLNIRFVNESMTCSVSVDPVLVHVAPGQTGPSATLANINCTTNGSPVKSAVYQIPVITGETQPLLVDSATGALRYNTSLTNPVKTNVTVTVQADVGDVKLKRDVTFVVITGDLSPTCTPGPSASAPIASFKEDVSPTSTCSDVLYTCTDYANLIRRCDRSSVVDFEIQCIDGALTEVKVCVAQSLQGNPRTINVTSSISNTFGAKSLVVIVNVTNVNDRPVITASNGSDVIRLNVFENVTVGTSISTLAFFDPDVAYSPANDKLTASLTDNNGVLQENLPFAAVVNGQQNAISLLLSTPLTQSKLKSFGFQLKVSDRLGLSDNVTVNITVVDVNQPPICDSPLNASASVRDPVDFVVTQVRCTDPDFSPQFSAVDYVLEGFDSLDYQRFSINKTGHIRIAQSLANMTSSNASVTFRIMAIDGGGLTTTVIVNVRISNSFPPECNNGNFVFETAKSEETLSNVCFTVSTNCTEPVKGEAILYSFSGGNGTALFRLNADAGSSSNLLMSVCTTTNLQNKYGTYEITGAIRSSYGERQFRLRINVNDVNDPPVFIPIHGFSTLIGENVPVGHTIFRVSAADPDSGPFGIVTYTLEPTSPFNIDVNTGEISVISVLDAEVRTFHILIVKATDGAPIPLQTTATVTITIKDINDNPPVCETSSVSARLDVTAPVGTLVASLVCNDADVSDDFKQLRYAIQLPTSGFTVNQTGHVTIASVLPREITEHVILIKVTDVNMTSNANFTKTVTVTLAVNNKIQPVCKPASVAKTLPENSIVGSCLDAELFCEDPTNGTPTLVATSGSASTLLEIRTHNPGTKLGLNACILSSLNGRVGKYELFGIVTNGLANTTLTWTFTVTNVNDAPMFYGAPYNVTVDELKPADTVNPILVLSVGDPDTGLGNQTFELVSVEAELTNNAQFNNAASSLLFYVPKVYSFYALTLNATERNLYTFRVNASDGAGLSAITYVYVHVRDLNSAPVCGPNSVYNSSIDILAVPGKQLIQLRCWDTDIDTKNKRLQYAITGGDADKYFNVTADGVVVVGKPLPRNLLYQNGSTVLRIRVQDSADVPLDANVTAIISVDNKIPATCSPGFTPPGVWVQGRCAIITMDCTDPTMVTQTHLTYLLSGNYTQGFNNGTVEGNKITMCYKLVQSGKFEIIVDVDNGLSNATYRQSIDVNYSQATPVFSASRYDRNVNETVAVGSLVFTASATSENLIGSIVYRVRAAEPDNAWNQYFKFDGTSGILFTNSSLKPLADKQYVLKIEAEDTGSKLKSETSLQLSIIDINEPPQCNVNAINVNNVPVDVDVGTVLVTFACTDADTKPAFSTLQSSLQSDTQSFRLNATGLSGSIETSALLGVMQGLYTETLKVQDEGGLQFVKVINITVNLLPPPVKVKVTEVSHNHAKVTWSYERPDFTKVTNSYVVTLKMAGGSASNFSLTVSDPPEMRLVDLQPETNYSVVVTAVTVYGRRPSSAIDIKTLAVPVLSHVTATIRALQITYDEKLRDPEKTYYFETVTFVRAQLEFVLKQPRFKGFASLAIKGFRPANSIYVDFVVAVNQSGSAQETIAQLNATVTSGWMGNMSVDSSYFVVTSGDKYIKINNVTFRPVNVYNGTNVDLTCNVVTVGYNASDPIKNWWTFKGVQIRPTDGSRFNITSSIPDPKIPENRQFTLSIEPALNHHDGAYECHVQDAPGNQSDVARIQLPVIAQPTVLIEPTNVSILYDASVNVTCITVMSYKTFNDFLWFRNGQLFQPNASAVTVGNEHATLTISGVKENVVYACAGRNIAGIGPMVSMSIHVRPKPNEPVKCPENKDLQGTTWPETVPGNTVTFRCPNDSTGDISRNCSATGLWELPVYACVRIAIKTIWDTVNNIKDGASSVNLSSVLGDLSDVTKDTNLYQGDIDTTMNTLDTVVYIMDQQTIKDPDTEWDFLTIASNLIDERNQPSWQTRIERKQLGAIDVPQLVERFLDQKFDQLQADKMQTFPVKNIYVNMGQGKRSNYQFPDRTSDTLPDWLKATQTGINIPAQAFNGLPSLHYASSFYRNITPILVKKLMTNGVVETMKSTMDINSDIVAFQIKESGSVLDPPAEITFQHFDSNYSNPICCYWNFTTGTFVRDGCKLVSTSAEKTVCACSHFTNFAILMSPGRASPADVKALSIISAVGCAISIFCLAITVVAYLLVWRYVKSDRAVLLLSLCVALIISYALFLGGVDRVANEAACTVISALLHYFYLVVFFTMLAYGVEIAISVIYVFETDSRLKWLLPVAWGAPVIIVAVSLGVTKTEGYGNDEFCWLSVEDGVLWAFVGPALCIILINTIIVITVIHKMFKSSAMMTKSDKEKARLGVRSICVLLPILGITWVFGVFSVNEQTVAFQYIFAVCNALQGVLIFVFHCVFNKQLRQGLKQRNVRKKTLASIEKDFKNQQSTGYTSVDPKSSGYSNESESTTTNPFLMADRQMKELTKNKKGGSNIYDNNVNNQKEAPNKAVDLDDVKISNILRESEVMSGTAGISSILDVDRKPDRSVQTPEAHRKFVSWFLEENSLRQSQGSQNISSSYDRLDTGIRDSHKYMDVVAQTKTSSKDSWSDRSRNKRQGTDDEKLRQQEIAKAKKIEKEKQERDEKLRKENEARQKERLAMERKEREREEERQRRDRHGKSNVPQIRIGYERPEDPYSSGSKLSKNSRSSRSDDDYEGGSAQNISSISTALPQKYEHSAGRKKKDSSRSESKKTSSLPKSKKDKKKGSHSKDRSRLYEYPYEGTYLGGQSRHASLENMNMQPQYGYSPYGHGVGAAGYQTGRPSHQKQQWGQYGDPYSYCPQEPYRGQQTKYW
ncbi:hypothetical protein DPMN_051330 [Dreissena polymorpha]|uniref:Uncharacterized protein n=1 Tax=Dreissena polymorpha TaxID=45954 RepID=A0A9D4HNT8_DREPO|nr:hypothetical protein DPMN_051330 [Dreissena polymorpha]